MCQICRPGAAAGGKLLEPAAVANGATPDWRTESCVRSNSAASGRRCPERWLKLSDDAAFFAGAAAV
jgi:hypothetical protein